MSSVSSYTHTYTPLLHLLLHVDALFLQQLSLSEGPVDGLHRCLSARRPLSLQTGLLWVVETKHMALSHDDAIPYKMQIGKSFKALLYDDDTVMRKRTLA